MDVTVDVAAGETRTVAVHADATYGDLLDPFDLGPQTATVFVDGRPRPADAPVAADVDRVRVVRLVTGG